MIGRREFITMLGGATALPLAAHAQQPAKPVIGFISSRSPGESAARCCWLPAGLSASRVCRTSERHNRVSLGGKSL